MIGQVSLAVLAAVDLVGVQVDVVRQAHGGGQARSAASTMLRW